MCCCRCSASACFGFSSGADGAAAALLGNRDNWAHNFRNSGASRIGGQLGNCTGWAQPFYQLQETDLLIWVCWSLICNVFDFGFDFGSVVVRAIFFELMFVICSVFVWPDHALRYHVGTLVACAGKRSTMCKATGF